MADLEASFAFLRKAMEAQAAADLTKEITVFGRKTTAQETWILTVTHLHEHPRSGHRVCPVEQRDSALEAGGG
jgi:hypothetical protein